jgi:hypothetical protein
MKSSHRSARAACGRLRRQLLRRPEPLRTNRLSRQPDALTSDLKSYDSYLTTPFTLGFQRTPCGDQSRIAHDEQSIDDRRWAEIDRMPLTAGAQ